MWLRRQIKGRAVSGSRGEKAAPQSETNSVQTKAERDAPAGEAALPSVSDKHPVAKRRRQRRRRAKRRNHGGATQVPSQGGDSTNGAPVPTDRDESSTAATASENVDSAGGSSLPAAAVTPDKPSAQAQGRGGALYLSGEAPSINMAAPPHKILSSNLSFRPNPELHGADVASASPLRRRRGRGRHKCGGMGASATNEPTRRGGTQNGQKTAKTKPLRYRK